MANFNFNKIMLGGRLTADPENKQTTDGTSVTSFTVAVNRKGTTADGKAVADFFKVTAWRSLADFVAKFFCRGSAIFIVGTVQNRSYVDHEGSKRYVTEIIADEVSFVDSKAENTAGTSDGTGSLEKPAPLSSSFATAEDFETISGDDDLPF
jgi:single-strand DNA-binding protein